MCRADVELSISKALDPVFQLIKAIANNSYKYQRLLIISELITF